MVYLCGSDIDNIISLQIVSLSLESDSTNPWLGYNECAVWSNKKKTWLQFYNSYYDCIEPLLQFHCSCLGSGLSILHTPCGSYKSQRGCPGNQWQWLLSSFWNHLCSYTTFGSVKHHHAHKLLCFVLHCSHVLNWWPTLSLCICMHTLSVGHRFPVRSLLSRNSVIFFVCLGIHQNAPECTSNTYTKISWGSIP